MSTPVTHPLLSAYLRDLDLLLYGVDPGERAEVLAGVHEHLDASLTPASTDDDVRAVLAELGPPQSIADEAYAGRPGFASGAAARPQRSPWLAHVACFLNAVFILLVTLLALMNPHVMEMLVLPIVGWIPWVCLIVLTSMTEVWTSAEKFTSIFLTPALIVALALMHWVLDLLPLPWIVHLPANFAPATVAVLCLGRLVRSTR